MDFTVGPMLSNGHSPLNFTKFNSTLTTGLLKPISPLPLVDKKRSIPTFFEMMASEPDIHLRNQTQNQTLIKVPILASRKNQPPPDTTGDVGDSMAVAAVGKPVAVCSAGGVHGSHEVPEVEKRAGDSQALEPIAQRPKRAVRKPTYLGDYKLN
ncbi:hypothetical protein PTKIN_Ptkin05aG0059000 [Pterospermum kingtungense]